MERKEQWVGWGDIARAVGDLIVDEAKLVLKAIFHMPRPLASHGDHLFERNHQQEERQDMVYHDVTMPQNRWDSEGRYYEC